jgi:hypothetical protein
VMAAFAAPTAVAVAVAVVAAAAVTERLVSSSGR